MNNFFVYILASVFAFSCFSTLLEAQSFYSTELYGTIKTIEGDPVSKAHILNLTNQTGTISNNEGKFEILANKTDIIQISSIGFKNLLFVIPNTTQVKLIKYFTLTRDTINLSEATIYPFPQTLPELKKEFLEMPVEEEEQVVKLRLDKEDLRGTPQVGAIIKGPFTAIYDRLSREGKLRRKYEALMAYEYRKNEAAKIYNPELVAKITGLEDEEEIEKFMEYCELGPDFVMHAIPYDLYVAVKNCYKEFQKLDY